MRLKAVSGIMLTLLLIGVLKLGFGIQLVKADPRIWTVDDDGPADFSSIQEAINSSSVADGDTIFVRSGTYYEQVVVNKSVSLIGEDKTATAIITNVFEAGFAVYISANNVTVSGFEIRNDEGYCGIVLDNSSNCTVNGNIVKATAAIDVYGGSGNKISDNDIEPPPGGSCIFNGLVLLGSDNNVVTGNYLDGACHTALTLSNSHNNYIASNTLANHLLYSVKMSSSNNNSIVGNTIYSTPVSMGGHAYLGGSNSNVFYHNSFLTEVEDIAYVIIYVLDGSVNNTWDNGYPSGGNYWINYTGVDSNTDGIGDSSYEIDSNNIDHYPLMGMFSNFSVTHQEETYHVATVCNSTISDFQFNDITRIISFNVSGEDGTLGFCRVTISNIVIQDLWQGSYTVLVDGEQPLTSRNWTDGTYTYIYFTYQHSTHEVTIAQPTLPVGGVWIPVDKLVFLAPYIGLVSIIIVAVSISVAYIKYRKKQ